MLSDKFEIALTFVGDDNSEEMCLSILNRAITVLGLGFICEVDIQYIELALNDVELGLEAAPQFTHPWCDPLYEGDATEKLSTEYLKWYQSISPG